MLKRAPKLMAVPVSPENRRFVEEAVTTTDGSESEVHRLQSGCKSTWQLYVQLIVRKSSTTNYVQLSGFYCKGIFKLKPRRYKLHEFAVVWWRVTSIHWKRGDAFRYEVTDQVNASTWRDLLIWTSFVRVCLHAESRSGCNLDTYIHTYINT
jgi:hypothetical protein